METHKFWVEKRFHTLAQYRLRFNECDHDRFKAVFCCYLIWSSIWQKFIEQRESKSVGLREYAHLRFAVESKWRILEWFGYRGKVSISMLVTWAWTLKVGMVVLQLFLTLDLNKVCMSVPWVYGCSVQLSAVPWAAVWIIFSTALYSAI